MIKFLLILLLGTISMKVTYHLLKRRKGKDIDWKQELRDFPEDLIVYTVVYLIISYLMK